MKVQKFLFAVLLVTAGCSAHVAGGPDGNPVAPNKPSVFEQPAVAGPNVVGKWASACVSKDFGRGTRQATIEFKSATDFTYTNISYADRACTTVAKIETHVGLYQFSQKVSDTLYVIDYDYMFGNVTYKMDGQHLEADGGIIYISEFMFGNTDVNHDLPLTKVLAAEISFTDEAY